MRESGLRKIFKKAKTKKRKGTIRPLTAREFTTKLEQLERKRQDDNAKRR
jgi:hypothetical protein